MNCPKCGSSFADGKPHTCEGTAFTTRNAMTKINGRFLEDYNGGKVDNVGFWERHKARRGFLQWNTFKAGSNPKAYGRAGSWMIVKISPKWHLQLNGKCIDLPQKGIYSSECEARAVAEFLDDKYAKREWRYGDAIEIKITESEVTE